MAHQRLFRALIASVLCVSAACAQFSTSAATNLVVCNHTGDQTVPRMAACSDGGTFITWFDHASGNYDVYVQKLDANGYEVYAHNGLLVSANQQNTSLVDWNIVDDLAGGCVITFTDMRAGGDLDVYAYRIDGSGQFLWGANGITLSSNPDYEANPAVAALTDGSFVFVWYRQPALLDGRLVVQRVDASGVPQYGPSGFEINGAPGEWPSFPSIVAAPGGAYIISWIRATHTFSSPRHVYTQKFDSAGNAQWGMAPVAVYNQVALPIAYRPALQSDGVGGAWYAYHASVGAFNKSYVQHISAAGAEVLAHNGVEVSTEANRSKFDPSMAQLAGTGDVIVFFNKRDSGQGMWGITGQRVSAAGALLWGANGIDYIPYDGQYEDAPRAVPTSTGAMCFVAQAAANNSSTLHLTGFRVDGAGAMVWAGPTVQPSSVDTQKAYFGAVAGPGDSAVLGWRDSRTDAGDIYMQNVRASGAFGVAPATAAPYGCGINPPNTLVASGAPSLGTTFTLGVDNPTGSFAPGAQSFLAICAVSAPGYPCGILDAGHGMNSPAAPGEILVELTAPVFPILTGPAWAGPGSPAPFAFVIPNLPYLVGLSAFAQGALYDPVSGRLGYTNAIEVRLGP